MIPMCYALFPNFQNLNLMFISGTVAFGAQYWELWANQLIEQHKVNYEIIHC